MDKKKLPRPSKNFEDKTGYSERDRLLDTLLGLANPVSAYRNVRGALLEKGVIAPPKREINYNLMMDRAVPSKNFEDRTGGHQNFIRGIHPEPEYTAAQEAFDRTAADRYLINALQTPVMNKRDRIEMINPMIGMRELKKRTGDKTHSGSLIGLMLGLQNLARGNWKRWGNPE